MEYTTLSKRLNKRTGLTFDSDGVYVPFHQLVSGRSFKTLVANEDLSTLVQSMKDIMFEIDVLTIKINQDSRPDAIKKFKLKELKEEFVILYHTSNKYKVMKNNL